MFQKIHSEIALRALSAVGLVAVTLVALLWCGTFIFFVTALTGGILYEVLKAARTEAGLRRSVVGCLTYAQLVSLWPRIWYWGDAAFPTTASKMVVDGLMALWVIDVIYRLVRSLLHEGKKDFKGFLFIVVSSAYIFCSLHALGLLYVSEKGGVEGLLYTGGRFRIFGLFLIVWLTDTGAFLVGRALGGRKLAPRLSPGKTWSGFWGGIAVASIVCTTAAILSPYPLFPATTDATPWYGVLILTAILSVAAHAGDLIESAAKRYLGVKDMGTMIPGHGGLADRFDSLLLVSFVAFVISWVVKAFL